MTISKKLLCMAILGFGLNMPFITSAYDGKETNFEVQKKYKQIGCIACCACSIAVVLTGLACEKYNINTSYDTKLGNLLSGSAAALMMTSMFLAIDIDSD